MVKKIFFVVVFFLFADYSMRGQSSFLDSSFGTNGIVITNRGSAAGFSSVMMQADDKIVAAGGYVIRYNTDGTLDNSFGIGGIFTGQDEANVIALQPDGKIVALGGIATTIRLNTNGTLDNTFGVSGIDSTVNFWGGLSGNAIALQPDGKIIIAGQTNSTLIGVCRLLPNGQPDSTFGINGQNTYFGIEARGVAVMPDGRIVLGCTAYLYSFMAIRLLPDGSLDTSFNHTGSATTPVGISYNICHAMQLQADGKIILAGEGTFSSSGSNFVLVRCNVDGSLDSSFGGTGIVSVDFGENDDVATALYIAPDGKILVTGEASASGQNFALARLNGNGSIDSVFGNDGRITTSIQENEDFALGIAMQQDGKIVLAGRSFNGSYTDFTLARYVAAPAEGAASVQTLSDNPVLYPDPAFGKLYINSNCANHIININAIDIVGKEMDIGIYPPYADINVSGLSDGMYFFKLTFDDRQPVTQKILVQNR